MFLKNKNIIFKIKRSKVTDCAALSSIGKVMEKIIHKHMFNYFNDHSIITCLQSGFVPGDSTVNQLVDIYNTFCKALDNGLEVRAVFCDISKAFDRVWH